MTVFFQQKTAGARTPQASLPPPPGGDSPVLAVSFTVRVSHTQPAGPAVRPHPDGGGGTFPPGEALTAAHLSVSPSSHARMASRCAAFTWVLCMRTPGRRNHFAYCSSHAHEGNPCFCSARAPTASCVCVLVSRWYE